MRNWSRYPEFPADLEALRHSIRQQVLNAKDFGVPQSRRRLFITCDREEEPVPIILRPCKMKGAVHVIDQNGTYKPLAGEICYAFITSGCPSLGRNIIACSRRFPRRTTTEASGSIGKDMIKSYRGVDTTQVRTEGTSRSYGEKNLLLNTWCRWRATFNSVVNSGSLRNSFKSGSVMKYG
jgi:site-specific DNA-cytosine methylase